MLSSNTKRSQDLMLWRLGWVAAIWRIYNNRHCRVILVDLQAFEVVQQCMPELLRENSTALH